MPTFGSKKHVSNLSLADRAHAPLLASGLKEESEDVSDSGALPHARKFRRVEVVLDMNTELHDRMCTAQSIGDVLEGFYNEPRPRIPDDADLYADAFGSSDLSDLTDIEEDECAGSDEDEAVSTRYKSESEAEGAIRMTVDTDDSWEHKSTGKPKTEPLRLRSEVKQDKPVKQMVPPEGVRRRLKGYKPREVNLDPMVRDVVVTRQFMSETYGGAPIPLYPSISEATRVALGGHPYHFAYPTLKRNPEVPLMPGAVGLLCRALSEVPWGDSEIELVVGIGEGMWAYLGNYTTTKAESLSKEEWNSLPERVSFSSSVSSRQ